MFSNIIFQVLRRLCTVHGVEQWRGHAARIIYRTVATFIVVCGPGGRRSMRHWCWPWMRPIDVTSGRRRRRRPLLYRRACAAPQSARLAIGLVVYESVYGAPSEH